MNDRIIYGDLEYCVTFSNGKSYILREVYGDDTYYPSSMELWDGSNILCEIPGVFFIDKDDEDAEEYNDRELAYIEQYCINKEIV